MVTNDLFYGDTVRARTAVSRWEVGAPNAEIVIRAGETGTFIDRGQRAGMGIVNRVRFNTSRFKGWCLLRDDEIEAHEARRNTRSA